MSKTFDVIVTAEALTPEAFNLLEPEERTAYVNGMSMLINSKSPESQKVFKDFLESGIMRAEYDAYVKSIGPISVKPMPHAYWFARRICGLPEQVARDVLCLKHAQINETAV